MADTNELSLPGSVPVSNIVLGTMYFGSRISQTQSERLLDTFVSMGGNQIDTARCYATGFQRCRCQRKGNWKMAFRQETLEVCFSGNQGRHQAQRI